MPGGGAECQPGLSGVGGGQSSATYHVRFHSSQCQGGCCDVALEIKHTEKGEVPAPTHQELGLCLEPISLVQGMDLSYPYSIQHPPLPWGNLPPPSLELVSIASSDLSPTCATAIPAPFPSL